MGTKAATNPDKVIVPRREVAGALDLGQGGPTRRKLLARLQGEITKGGTIDVLRHGLKHGPHQLDLPLWHALAGQQ